MMMTRVARLIFVLGVAVGGGSAFAQTSRPATQPELTFVPGDQKPLASLWRGSGPWAPQFETFSFLATIETSPSLAEWFGDEICEEAMKEAFGPGRALEQKGDGHGHGSAYLLALAIIQYDLRREADGTAAADVWTIGARDARTAESVVRVLAENYQKVAAKHLSGLRAERTKLSDEMEACRKTIAQAEAQLKSAKDECRNDGVQNMTDEAMGRVIARLEQEQRLTEIDIVGLQASLARVKSRLGASQVSPEALATLSRMEVELDVNLAGKLAREEACAKELARLQAGQELRGRIQQLRAKIGEQRRTLEGSDNPRALERRSAELSKYLGVLQQVDGFPITNSRVQLNIVLGAVEARGKP